MISEYARINAYTHATQQLEQRSTQQQERRLSSQKSNVGSTMLYSAPGTNGVCEHEPHACVGGL